MTAFVPGLLVGYILGVFSIALLGALIVLHRPRYEAPTLSRRRNRDRVPEVITPERESPPEPVYMYGVTGLEE
jgi:hypothetical protein